jgi:hypothetical protein
MKRPFKKFRNFVLIDTDSKEVDQSDSTSMPNSNSSATLIINDTPTENEKKVASLSQK